MIIFIIILAKLNLSYNRPELEILKESIPKINTKAFLTVINANEILSRGFKSLDEKIG
ncbi:MAG: hypothetical protein WCL51_05655 [Bacteroidota bacterium]